MSGQDLWRTGRIRLRHALHTDYPALYAMESDPTTTETWRYRGALPPIEQYEPVLWQQTAAILVVEAVHSGEAIGYCQLYDVDLRAGHGWFSIYSAREHRGSGLVMEGLMVFCDWAFGSWPLRWLYAHSFASNVGAFASGIRRGDAVELGVLQERVIVGDAPMDVHVIGVERAHYLASAMRQRLRSSRLRADRGGDTGT